MDWIVGWISGNETLQLPFDFAATTLRLRGHCPSTSLRDRVAEVQGPPNTNLAIYSISFYHSLILLLT